MSFRAKERDASEGLVQLSEDPLQGLKAKLKSIFLAYKDTEGSLAERQQLTDTINLLLRKLEESFSKKQETIKQIREHQRKGVEKADFTLDLLLVEEHALKEENDLIASALGFYIHRFNAQKFKKGKILVNLWIGQVKESVDSLENSGLRKNYPNLFK